MEDKLGFCTLGMFIIDEIEYVGGKTPEKVVIGGAGTYAAIGARLVAGERFSKSVSWIVDVGSDFPSNFRSTIESWQTACLFREDANRLTTRAWNAYSGENEHRAFKYLTPKIRLDQNSLSPVQVMADSFHFVCSSERCISLTKGIMQRRETTQTVSRNNGEGQGAALMVWEPVPELCIPEEREKFKEAIQYVEVVSPNAAELAGFFQSENPGWSEEGAAKEVLSWGIGPQKRGALVIRQGSQGCAAYLRNRQFHLRPYHLCREMPSRVVDPTGGGNAFLGALALAMTGKVTPSMSVLEGVLGAMEPHRWLLGALIYATVAASFVIEQPGMPLLSGVNGEQKMWNGETFDDRLLTYLSREHAYITQQLTDHNLSV